MTELPFPFLRVSDYEASIRGPVGRTFVPEIVHKKLVTPAVRTKMGTVIAPMDQAELLSDPKIRKAVDIKLNMIDNEDPTVTETKKKKKNNWRPVLDLSKRSVKIKKFTRRTTAARIN